MPANYYIYAGGRWCEVDTRRGRVEGSRQRARFCFLRGGRLEVARTAHVLRALRALATGAGGAARDAAPLPRSRPRRWRKDSIPPAHVCCSHHTHNSRCDLTANKLADQPPLHTITLSTASSPRKRKRSSSDDVPRKPGKGEVSKKGELGEIRVRSKEEQRIVQRLLQSSSEDSVKERSKKQALKTKSSPEKNSKDSQMRRGSEAQKIVQCLLQSSSDDTKTKPKPSPRKTNDKQLRIQSSSDDVGKKKKVRSVEEEKLVQSLLQSSSEDNEDPVPERPQTARRSEPQQDHESSSSDEDVRKPVPCKELVIDDTTVDIMRNYLADTVGWDAVLRFDSDVAYKTRLFYKLTPIVSLQRCKPMEKLLKQKLSLTEFARHLGLRSVADVTPEKRYRMRHSTRQARRVTSESETEKEVVQPKRRQLWNRDKEVFNSFRSSRASEVRERPQIPKPSRESSADNTDSEAEIKKHIRRNLERRASARLNPERKETRITNKNNDESVIVSDDDVADENQENDRKTRAKAKNDESVVVSDDSDENRGKSRRTRATSRAERENESVLVSDDSDSNKKKSTRSRENKTVDDNESVIVSDDSDSDDNPSKSSRRTRSQGPQKRVLRDQNKSVLISDDSDGKTSDNRENIKSQSKVGKSERKADDENNSKTDENKSQLSKTRSRYPDRALRDQNGDNNRKKETDDKNNKGIDSSTESNRKTRSSIKGTDTVKDKTETKKDQPNSIKTEIAKRRENKHEAIQEVAKDSPKKFVEKSSDDELFEKSPKKNNKRPSFLDLKRNEKGRFLKRNVTNVTEKDSKANKKQDNSDSKSRKNNDTQISEDEDENLAEDNVKQRTDKGIQKHRKEIDEMDSKQSKSSERNNKTGKDGKSSKDDKEDQKRDKSNQRHKNRTDVRNKISEQHRIVKGSDETRGKDDKDEQKRQNEGGSRKKRNENTNLDKNEKQSTSARMLLKPLKFKKSSVANGREYTSLEDHAIVAWVSAGRERMVNGNAVWRELQQQYTRLTSQTRTWHSLRNRYLRYILPSLASLALPQSQISRLRAAAATGKIKSRGRRNSIYNVPRVISASAAGRQRPRWSDSDHGDTTDHKTSPPRARLASPSTLSNLSPPRPSKTTSPSKRSLSLSKQTSNKSSSPTKRVLSLSKNSPKRPNLSLSKRPLHSPSKTAISPSKRLSPSKPGSSGARSRSRSSLTSPPPVKKKRIHHL